jgi:hypothetical protein
MKCDSASSNRELTAFAGEERIKHINAIGADDAGTVWVADGGAHQVLALSPEGARVATFAGAK